MFGETKAKKNQPHTVKHNRAPLLRHTHKPRLLAQLSHRTFFRCLACIYEACGDLDCDFIDGWAVLLLQEEFRACGFGEDGDDADTVDGTVFGAGLDIRGK